MAVGGGPDGPVTGVNEVVGDVERVVGGAVVVVECFTFRRNFGRSRATRSRSQGQQSPEKDQDERLPLLHRGQSSRSRRRSAPVKYAGWVAISPEAFRQLR